MFCFAKQHPVAYMASGPSERSEEAEAVVFSGDLKGFISWFVDG